MIQWTDSIRQSGRITFYIAALAGNWGHVFRQALHDFNVLCAAHRLRITFTESKVPAEKEDGADVQIQTAAGSYSASYGRESKTGVLEGTRLHGRTLLFSREPDNVLERAFIYLPEQPKVNTPAGLRAAGAGVMKVIAAHELLHACGLENSDHSSDDLFQGNPRVDAGDRASEDKVLIGTGPKKMPALYLGAATAKMLKESFR
jgi:hypothetical protein